MSDETDPPTPATPGPAGAAPPDAAPPPAVSGGAPAPADGAALVRRHLRFGWWTLLLFLLLGIALEALHGFKVGFLLDVSNSTRREMWRLAHAHGTLLALVHVAFAWTQSRGAAPLPGARLASACLVAASLLLPGGFFLGGLVTYGGDPGLGILLVPVGALAFALAVATTAWGVSRAPA